MVVPLLLSGSVSCAASSLVPFLVLTHIAPSASFVRFLVAAALGFVDSYYPPRCPGESLGITVSGISLLSLGLYVKAAGASFDVAFN